MSTASATSPPSQTPEAFSRTDRQAAWRALYPFESHTLSTDGGRYHYLDEGQGKPLCMVHGNPTWSFYWRNLVTGLRENYRVVAPDHIGCGLSDKPQKFRYSLPQHADNLVALIRALDLRDITMCVHDWGGPIGLRAAAEVRDRIGRLILFNTGAFPPPFVPWRIRVCRVPLLGQFAVQGLNLFALAATRMALHDPRRMPRAAKQGMLAPYDNWSHRTAIYRFVKDIPTTPRHPTWQSLEELEQSLSKFRDVPTCMIWGTQDWCFRTSCLDQLQALLPHAQVHRMENAGHWVVEEQPEEVLNLVQTFLAATD